MPGHEVLWVGGASLERLRLELAAEGVQSLVARHPSEARGRLGAGASVGLIVLGPDLEPEEAEAFARWCKKPSRGFTVLFVARGSSPLVGAAMAASAPVFTAEPAGLERLLDEIRRFDVGRSVGREERSEPLMESFCGIVGRHPRTRELVRKIRTMANHSATVLIRGESGTGKELVARALHEAGVRRGRPFLAINCAAIPPPLLESSLFGHVRGAFTGAERDRAGHFVAAGEGTLFLDEIAELAPELQVKLLRSLQEREVLPIGSSRPVSWHARLVCATNVDLEERVRQGRFREDLFYRIHVLDLRVPPLRERPSDIPLLARWFLAKHPDPGGRVRKMSEGALRILESYPWPGNVRELENVVVRAIFSTTAATIGPEDLCRVLPIGSGAAPSSESTFPTYDQVSYDHIVRALRLCRGVQTSAARLLGMDRNRLARMIRRHRIDLARIAREFGDRENE